MVYIFSLKGILAKAGPSKKPVLFNPPLKHSEAFKLRQVFPILVRKFNEFFTIKFFSFLVQSHTCTLFHGMWLPELHDLILLLLVLLLYLLLQLPLLLFQLYLPLTFQIVLPYSIHQLHVRAHHELVNLRVATLGLSWLQAIQFCDLRGIGFQLYTYKFFLHFILHLFVKLLLFPFFESIINTVSPDPVVNLWVADLLCYRTCQHHVEILGLISKWIHGLVFIIFLVRQWLG